jgi:hypothetical protein
MKHTSLDLISQTERRFDKERFIIINFKFFTIQV